MSQNPTVVVFVDMIKSHVRSFTRKDGVFVAEHDNGRADAGSTSILKRASNVHEARKAALDTLPGKRKAAIDASELALASNKGHAEARKNLLNLAKEHDSHAEIAYDYDDRETMKELSQHRWLLRAQAAKHPDAKPGFAEKAKKLLGLKKSTLMVSPDLLKSHINSFTRKDGSVVQAHDDKRQAAAPKPAAAEPRLALPVKKAAAQAKDALYDKDQSGLGPHKVGDAVSYKGERGSTRTGKVKGSRDGKVVVEHKAGYTEMKHHSELSSASTKTGSAAPAKTVNVGSEKWPMHAKSSEKLAAKHDDGSTHHVGGFEPPSNGKGDHLIHHDGKAFSFTGKSGKNMKTGEASYEYGNKDDSDRRAWVTHSGHLMND
jgi:ribosomal protein L20